MRTDKHMNLILLGGESLLNKDWIENVEHTLRPLFEKTAVIRYGHWQTGQGTIDLGKEYSKLTAAAKDMEPYLIFAKSIGTVLAIRGIYEQKLSPVKCIFIGPAFLVGEQDVDGFKNWIENYSVPTLFLTKTADPVAPAALLRNLLRNYHVQNYQFIEIPGSDHKYEDLIQIKSLTEKWIKK